ncbi:MAG TPA: hypothetical protein VHC20_06300, partial [Candidatus Paceibacterota bacterium]|nr:hypothetical protein [Candidatus Paceibacterota bacterium]
VVGNYALGSLNETLALEEKHPEAEMRVRAGLLKRALPYAESMSMTEKTLRLTGEPGFVYLVSGL